MTCKMKYLFITDITPLSPLLDFDINNINIDLHNDFECIEIKSNQENLEFYFNRNSNNEQHKEQNAVLIFSNIAESNIDLIVKNNKIGDLQTLTNFARGELTQNNKFYQNNNIKYFFLDFSNGALVNIFCKEAIIFLW